jgi:hypothetical protein
VVWVWYECGMEKKGMDGHVTWRFVAILFEMPNKCVALQHTHTHTHLALHQEPIRPRSKQQLEWQTDPRQ